MLPNQVFFIPNPSFLDSFTEYVKKEALNVVDCGAGIGHLSKLLIDKGIKTCAIDLYPRENPQTEIIQMDAINFPFSAGMLAVIARPCHGDWVPLLIKKAVEAGAQVMYIGLKKNFGQDITGLGLAHWIFSKDAGVDGEYAIVFRNRKNKNNAYSVYGDNITDMPSGAIRYKRYHKYSKRKMSISILRFTGIGLHYYVTVEEDNNQYWNEKEQVWQRFWDDDSVKGIYDTKRFNTLKEAEAYIKKVKRKYKHHIIETPEEDIKYYYDVHGG